MRNNRCGAALLLVIVIVGLLSLLVAEFQRKAHLDAVSAANGALLLQAHALSRSGTAAAIALLKEDLKQSPTITGRTGIWYFAEPQAVPVEEYTVSLQIEDQYGKFPINALVDARGIRIPAREKIFRQLLDNLELGNNVNTQNLTDALGDWIDKESTASDNYEQNDHFAVPNEPIIHLDDLNRISGFDTLQYWQLQKIKTQLDTRSDSLINVNTASLPLLWALNPSLSEAQARAKFEALGSGPVTDAAAASGQHIAPASPPQAGFTAKGTSTLFRIVVRGEANGVARQSACVIFRDPKKPLQPIRDWIQY